MVYPKTNSYQQCDITNSLRSFNYIIKVIRISSIQYQAADRNQAEKSQINFHSLVSDLRLNAGNIPKRLKKR